MGQRRVIVPWFELRPKTDASLSSRRGKWRGKCRAESDGNSRAYPLLGTDRAEEWGGER